MKRRNRNGLIYISVIIVTIIVYLVIHLYCDGLRKDIYKENSEYANNLPKQPINNIITIDEKEENGKNNNGKDKEKFGKDIVFTYENDRGNYIYLINQFPIVDEIGKSLQGEKHTQDFKLRFNEKAVGVKYIITAERLFGSNLLEKWTKLFLVNDGADVMNCYRSNGRVKSFNEYEMYMGNINERILYRGEITSSEAARGYKDFTFRMWVSEDLHLVNSNYLSQTKTFKTVIHVYAIGK